MKKTILFIAIIILIPVILCNSSKLVINIKNNKKEDIHNFNIIYSSETIVIPIIRRGELKSITLNPRGESSLEINFKVDKILISKKYDTYFEGGAIGIFEIEIFDDKVLGYEETYPACIYKYIDSNSYKPLIEYKEH